MTTDITTAFNTYAELSDEVKTIQETTRKLIREAVLGAAKQVFANHPKVHSFSVHGYHPSFNDGDPCSFSFCNDAYAINGCGSPNHGRDDDEEEEDDENVVLLPTKDDWDSGLECDWSSGKCEYVKVREPGWAGAANTEITELFGKFSESDIEAEFDSNFVLTFTRSEKQDGNPTMNKEYYDCGH